MIFFAENRQIHRQTARPLLRGDQKITAASCTPRLLRLQVQQAVDGIQDAVHGISVQEQDETAA